MGVHRHKKPDPVRTTASVPASDAAKMSVQIINCINRIHVFLIPLVLGFRIQKGYKLILISAHIISKVVLERCKHE